MKLFFKVNEFFNVILRVIVKMMEFWSLVETYICNGVGSTQMSV